MKYLTLISALTTLSILSLSTAASAGTSVTNATTVRNSVGTFKTDISVVKSSNGVQNNFSQSLKMESLAPTSFAQVTFHNGSFSGNAWGSTDAPVDPYAIGTYSSQYETVYFNENSLQNTLEQGTFNETSNIHTVSSDYF